jgi:hypothetical protein
MVIAPPSSSSPSPSSGGGVVREREREEGQPTFLKLTVRCAASKDPVMGSPFRVRLFPSLRGRHVRCIGQRGAGPLQFSGPGSLAVDGDLLYVGDGDNNRCAGLVVE